MQALGHSSCRRPIMLQKYWIVIRRGVTAESLSYCAICHISLQASHTAGDAGLRYLQTLSLPLLLLFQMLADT